MGDKHLLNCGKSLKTDEKFFTELYNTYKNTIYNTAMFILGNRALAEEITQEVFLTIYSKAMEIRHPESIKKWITTVTTNACINCLKKESKIIPYEENVIKNFYDKSNQSTLEDKLIQKELYEEVFSLILQLPKNLKIPTILYYYNDFSYEEISSIMNCPTGTVKSRLFNAKKIIRKEMMKNEPDYIIDKCKSI